MNHTVTVALVVCAPIRWFLRIITPVRVAAELRVRRKYPAFDILKFLSGSRHEALLKKKTLPCKSQIGMASKSIDRNPVAMGVRGQAYLLSGCPGAKANLPISVSLCLCASVAKTKNQKNRSPSSPAIPGQRSPSTRTAGGWFLLSGYLGNLPPPSRPP